MNEEEAKKFLFDKIKEKLKQIPFKSIYPTISANLALRKAVDEIIKDQYLCDDIAINVSGDRENQIINAQLTFRNPSPALRTALEKSL
jgi:hypothetical protein